METEYCPNCIVDLIPDKKKLGLFTNWLICTKCGLRKRSYWYDQETKELIDRIKESNKNLNEFNNDEEDYI